MENIYKLHLLKHIVKKEKNLEILEKKGGYYYLISWLRNIVSSKNYLLLESILEILNAIFKEKCKLIDHYEVNLNKPELNRPTNLLNQLIEELYVENLIIPFDDEFPEHLAHEIVDLLLDIEKNASTTKYNFPSK